MMLTLADIIRAPKSNVQAGPWKTGKVPNAALPLGRALKYGPSWDWRLVEFDALGQHFRVLILLSEETERYSAILALDHQKGCLVLCHHDLHTSHKLWHCHLIKGNVWETFPNVLRDKNRMVAWPKSSGKRWSQDFPVTKANALSIAAKRYRFEEQGGLC